MYKRLIDARNVVSSETMIIAEDVSGSGQKIFYVGSLDKLNGKYSTIKRPHWYECLLENRASRIFLDIESDTSVDLDNILNKLTIAIQQKFGQTPIIEILDSCSAKKQSWHILCTNIWMKNVYHVGAFIRRLVLYIEEEAIDTSVYTRNRMFRVKRSSKYGSTRILKHSKPWYMLLVQSNPSEPPKTIYECKEIDGSEPVSNSKHPSQLFAYENGQWHGLRQKSHSETHSVLTNDILEPIVKRIDELCDGNLYRHKMSMTSTGQIFCSTKSRKCAIAGRQHRGNNIWFEIDLVQQRVFQHCYDDECKGKRYEIQGLDPLWIPWNNCWSISKEPHEWAPESFSSKNENTLYNMVD